MLTTDTATTNAADPTAPRGTTTDLAELVCRDPQWLHREFAELIAANYPPSAAAPARVGRRPRVRPVSATRIRRWPRPGPAQGPTALPARAGRACAPTPRPARQRSPPTTVVPAAGTTGSAAA